MIFTLLNHFNIGSETFGNTTSKEEMPLDETSVGVKHLQLSSEEMT